MEAVRTGNLRSLSPRRRHLKALALVLLAVWLPAAPTVRAFDSTPYPGPNPPDGTATYPWRIDLPEDFDAIGTDGIHLGTQYYLLTKDLDFGNEDHRVRVNFTGSLDGGYHTISNVRADQPSESHGGLIKNMFFPSVIRRLAIVGSYFRFRDAAGAIVGAMQWGTLVEECYSQGNTIIAVSGNGQGGIVGASSYERPAAVVRNSYARDNSVSSGFQTVGGICGYNDAQVERCYSAGNTLTAPRYVGGVVGYGGSGTIVDSYSDVANSPSVQLGSANGTWQNTLVANRYTSDFNITLYSIVQLNWDPAIWTKGADNYPCLMGFNSPPVAKCKNVTVSADQYCTADGSIDDGSFDPDPGDSITLTQSPPGPYPLGDTLVTLTVTDHHGASSQCSATVTVVDTTPPSFTTPDDLTVNADSPIGAMVTFDIPVAADNCSVASVVCDPASGTLFPIGTTTVTCQAIDMAGNSSSGTFTVHVKAAAEQLPDLIDLTQNLPINRGLKQSLVVKLRAAKQALDRGHERAACLELRSFLVEVRGLTAVGKLTPAQADPLIADASRIRAVIGCP